MKGARRGFDAPTCITLYTNIETDKLFTLRESRRGHWRLGGLEAGGSEPQVFLEGVFGRSLDVSRGVFGGP